MIGVELTPEEPISRLVSLARDAEGEGFDTVFLSHHYNNRDPFVALASIAAATADVSLGPGVVNPYETHPVSLAARMATIDELADGRGVFGIGAGDRSMLENLGIDRDRPLRRILETMQVARQLWVGERVDHDGTFVADAAGLNFETGPIPVYVGAQGPGMIRMAATHADGVLFNGSHPKDVRWARKRVGEGLENREFNGGSFDFAVYASVSVATDRDRAIDAARPPVAFITGGCSPAVLDRHGIDHTLAERIGNTLAAGDYRDAFGLVTERMIDAFCIAGTPETVHERVEEIDSIADSFVMGSPLGPDLDAALELMDTSLLSDRA